MVCTTKAFLVLMSDHGIDAVPEPGPRPGSGNSTCRGITEQVRVENTAIGVDPSSNCNTSARVRISVEGPADTTSEWDVADEVVRYAHVAHPLLHDALQGVRVPCRKIRCVRRRVCSCSECGSAGNRALVLHGHHREDKQGTDRLHDFWTEMQRGRRT